MRIKANQLPLQLQSLVFFIRVVAPVVLCIQIHNSLATTVSRVIITKEAAKIVGALVAVAQLMVHSITGLL